MRIYYNEIDITCANWLYNLMKEGAIPKGDIDTRSIVDIDPSDLIGYDQWHLFAGIGGWPYALSLSYLRKNTGILTASAPCQPFSVAGKGKGFEDERHLWPYVYDIIKIVKPSICYGEQVAGGQGYAWLSNVFYQMETINYRCASSVLTAASVGAYHKRRRIYWVSDNASDSEWHKQPRKEPCYGKTGRMGREFESVSWERGWQDSLRKFRTVDDGLSYGVVCTDAPRNAIIPKLASRFIEAHQG